MSFQYTNVDLSKHQDKSLMEIYEYFEWDIPEIYNVCDDILEQKKEMEKVAIYYDRSQHPNVNYTYSEISNKVDMLAKGLNSLGIEPGDSVGVALSQQPETLITHLAAYKIGAVTVPMSVLTGVESMKYRIKEADISTVITTQTFQRKLKDIDSQLEHVIAIDNENSSSDLEQLIQNTTGELPTFNTRSDDPCLILFTSGTTGDPEGVVHAHECFLSHHASFRFMHDFPADDSVVFTPADWSWVAGLFNTVLPAWRDGLSVVGYDAKGFNPKRVFQILEDYSVTHTMLTPTMLRMLREEVAMPKVEYDLSLDVIVTGGEPTTKSLFTWVDEAFDGVTMNEHYGQTEADLLLVNSRSMKTRKQGSLGRPSPGHRVDIIDDKGNVKETGEIGKIGVKSPDPVLMKRYLNSPEKTNDSYIGDWFDTGDLGYKDEDGHFWFAGREDDLIITSGYRVSPVEIEDKLTQHEMVKKAVVFATEDDIRGEIITAVIQPSQVKSEYDDPQQAIKTYIKSELAKYKHPREIFFVDQFPTTSSDKVDRSKLKTRFNAG